MSGNNNINKFNLSSLGTTALTAGSQIFGNLFSNSQNKELAEYNWEQARNMWHEQNEYNSPVAQMERYRDAGLNPNLIYGSGASAGNASSFPTPQLPTMRSPTDGVDFRGFSAEMRQNALIDSDIKQKDSVSEYNKAAANAKTQEAALTALKAIGEQYNNEANEYMRPYLKRVAEANLKKLESSALDIEQRTEWFDVTYNERMTQLKQAGANLFKEGEKIDAETGYYVQKSFESAENVIYLQTKAQQLQYELDTNPSVETKKAFNETMLQLNQSIKEVEEFVSQGGKYGRVIEPYIGVVTDVVDSAMGWYKLSKGVSKLSKASKAPAVPK